MPSVARPDARIRPGAVAPRDPEVHARTPARAARWAPILGSRRRPVTRRGGLAAARRMVGRAPDTSGHGRAAFGVAVTHDVKWSEIDFGAASVLYEYLP